MKKSTFKIINWSFASLLLILLLIFHLSGHLPPPPPHHPPALLHIILPLVTQHNQRLEAANVSGIGSILLSGNGFFGARETDYAYDSISFSHFVIQVSLLNRCNLVNKIPFFDEIRFDEIRFDKIRSILLLLTMQPPPKPTSLQHDSSGQLSVLHCVEDNFWGEERRIQH